MQFALPKSEDGLRDEEMLMSSRRDADVLFHLPAQRRQPPVPRMESLNTIKFHWSLGRL